MANNIVLGVNELQDGSAASVIDDNLGSLRSYNLQLVC